MKNFTQQIKTTILLSVLVLLAITVKAQSGNYFVKHDGTVVKMHGNNASFDGYIYYIDENGKSSNIYQDKVKLLVFGKAVFYSRKEGGSLLRIIAFNDNYFIGGTLQSGSMVYWVFEREGLNTVGKRAVSLYGAKGKGTTKAHKKQYDDNFAIYFKDCNELNEACHKNMDEARSAFLDIDYFNCGSSTDLITNKPIDKNVKTKPVMEKEPVYFYVTNSGEKIIIEDETKGVDQDFKKNRVAALNPNFKYNIGLSYFNGMPVYKSKTVSSKSVKYIFLSDEIFAPLMIKGYSRIVSILCFNNDFVLGYDLGGKGFWFIYDRNISAIIDETDGKKIPFQDFVNNSLDKYFKDCSDLRKIVDENNKYHRGPLFGTIYYNCNNSKEIIEGIKFE